MLIKYTLDQSLAHLKVQIKRFEKKLSTAKTPYEKERWEDIIAWMFERGLQQITFAHPGEVDQDTIDYFLDRIPTRPDLQRLRDKIKKNYQAWLKKKGL